jgi:hypothetical protein
MSGIPYLAVVEQADQALTNKLWVMSYNSGWSKVGSAYLNRDQSTSWLWTPSMTNNGTLLYVGWAEQGNQAPWIAGSAYPGNSSNAAKPQAYLATLTTGGTETFLGGSWNADTANGSAKRPSITIYQNNPLMTWMEVNYGTMPQTYAKVWNGTDAVALGSSSPPAGTGTAMAGPRKTAGPVTKQ